MKDSASGLVRYRGLMMSPAEAKFFKSTIPYIKARNHTRKHFDPSVPGQSEAFYQRVADLLKPDDRVNRVRLYKAKAIHEELERTVRTAHARAEL